MEPSWKRWDGGRFGVRAHAMRRAKEEFVRRAVVTGGLGFIGTHVVDYLVESGQWAVTIVDSMLGAVTCGHEYDANPLVEVIRSPIESYLEDGGDFEGAHAVFHAASLVGPAGILQYAGQLGTRIVLSTQRVIDACIAGDVSLCTFSSAEVYGRSGRLAESDDVIVPTRYNTRLEYAIAKTLTEAITMNSRHRGLRGFVVRPFNVAGARQSRAGGFVMPTFVQQALAGNPLTVFSTGQQVRAFLAARDLASFVVDHFDAALDAAQPLYNVGNPANRTTIWDLALRVVHRAASASPIVYGDAKAIHGPLYEEARSVEKMPVISAAATLGWRPTVNLDDLIDQTISFYRNHNDGRAESQFAPAQQ